MSNIGKIVQVIGPVVDVDFSATGKLPEIYNALEINYELGGKVDPPDLRSAAATSATAGSAPWP